jgi:hypothetical protein
MAPNDRNSIILIGSEYSLQRHLNKLSEIFSVRTIIVIYNAIFDNITYDLLISWSRVFLEKPTVALLFRSPEFYGTGRFITVFTRAHHWSLFCARRI